ncbi:hypothetical protein T484DRAFT_1832737, partial [Baffinella frigidus]
GSISAAALACHARIKMAKRVLDAPMLHSDGVKGLLQTLHKKAEGLLTDFAAGDGAVRACSIDGFQGSENDVVVVSLTRSNPIGKVGFLREQARLVVAQSRARLGMYFVGNRATYDTVTHWREFSAAMEAQGRAGAELPLVCPRHPEECQHLSVKDAGALLRRPLCQHTCGKPKACGRHFCSLKCHSEEADRHSLCRELVDVWCKKGHLLKQKCFEVGEEVACEMCGEEDYRNAEREALKKGKGGRKEEVGRGHPPSYDPLGYDPPGYDPPGYSAGAPPLCGWEL